MKGWKDILWGVCVWGDEKDYIRGKRCKKVTVSGKGVHLAFEGKKGNDILE